MNLLLTLLLLYVAIVLAMFLLQRKLMYHPARIWLDAESYQDLPIDEVTLTSADGTKLQAWWIAGNKGFPTLVYYHGNAGNLADRLDKFTAYQRTGFNIMALSYRGYGASEGSPDEEGIYADARANMEYALKQKQVPLNKVMLYGESLGSGVAVQMATEYQVAGLVLEAPFTSLVNRAAQLYPWLPVGLLVKDRYDSIDKITQVNAPLLVFHNEGDRVVPIGHGRKLFAAANDPKQAWWLDGPGHVEFDWDFLAQKMRDFAAEQAILQKPLP